MTTPRLGEYLRAAREKSGLSIEQLADRTRVRIENLDALEREDLDALPADTYVRGFVKIVCRELKLPPDEGLALYNNLRSNSGLPEEIVWAEVDTNAEPGAFEKALQDPERVLRAAHRAKRIAIPAAVALVAALGFLLVRSLGSAKDSGADAPVGSELGGGKPPPSRPDSSPDGDPTPPQTPDSGEEAARAGGGTSGATATPEPGETPRVPGIAAPSTPAASAPQEVAESGAGNPPPGEDPRVDSASALTAAPSTDPVASAPVPAAPFPRVAPAAPAVKGPLVLEVEALREAEVTLVLDGAGFPRKRSLMAGETKSWKADSVFVLSASDGGAIRLRLDGADLGAAGADGQAVTNLRVRK